MENGEGEKSPRMQSCLMLKYWRPSQQSSDQVWLQQQWSSSPGWQSHDAAAVAPAHLKEAVSTASLAQRFTGGWDHVLLLLTHSQCKLIPSKTNGRWVKPWSVAWCSIHHIRRVSIFWNECKLSMRHIKHLKFRQKTDFFSEFFSIAFRQVSQKILPATIWIHYFCKGKKHIQVNLFNLEVFH